MLKVLVYNGLGRGGAADEAVGKQAIVAGHKLTICACELSQGTVARQW
jgi:hypothetical protein